METFFVSKYACSNGAITQIEAVARKWDDGSETVVTNDGWTYLQVGRDVFRTREAAVTDAINRRQKKVASLKKQIAKLDAMKFA